MRKREVAKPVDILVSSTYVDLKDERLAAIAAIERLEHAVRMEEFSASNELSHDECLLRLRECDGVVLLIGGRYGSIDPKTGYSVTELEYRTAKELGLPVFAFLKVGEDGSWHSAEEDDEKRAKHQAFKRLVDSERTRQTFRTPDELKFEVAAALDLQAKRYGRIGVRGSIFQTPHQFFQKYLDPSRVFSHTFPLVGRGDYVELLRDVPNVPQRVFILPGAGGMGKSKILHAGLGELVNAHPDVTVCLLGEGTTYTPEHASELPAGHIVIVVDDAHRLTTGLEALLALTQQFPDRIKLVLSTRLHGLPRVRQALTFAGFDSQEIHELPEVQPLTSKDVETLATEIMGPEAGPRLAQLVAISRDSPLITVIAGQLFVRKKLDPALLASDDSGAFRIHVLSRFQDELVGQVAAEVPQDQTRKVLQIVATLSPLDPDREPLIARAADLLKLEPHELLSTLTILQRSGVLLRQAGMLRITPDVLSDHILYETCFMGQGRLTGYGKRLIDTFRDLDLRTVLQNMAELDWRVSRGKGTGLLQEIWRELRQSYESGSNQDRLSLLGVIAPVAYFQPGETLELVHLALKIATSGDSEAPEEFSITNAPILDALAPILRNIAYYQEYVLEAVTLLWRIGRDENRPHGRETNIAVHHLQKIIAYERYTPLGYYELVFTWLEELARTEDAFQHRYSPLDLLPALLRREGTEEWVQGRTLNMLPFLIDPRNTAALRRRVLILLQTIGQRDEPNLRRTAIKELVNVILRGIIGLGNFRPTEEHFAVWQDEDRLILNILADLVVAEDNPVVLVEVEDDLLAVATDPKHAVISADVRRLISQLPARLESTLVRYMRQGRIQRRRLLGTQSSSIDPEALDAALEPELNQMLDAFFSTYSTPGEIKRELERLFAFFVDAGAEPWDVHFLLRRLCGHAPETMLAVCELLVADPDSGALQCIPSFLTELRSHNAERVLSCWRAAEASASPALRSMVAMASGAPNSPATEEEQSIIRRLALDQDQATALGGIRALSRFPHERYEDVFATLKQIEIGDDARLAREVCQLFNPQWGIDPQHLPKPFVSSMLEKLVPLADWSQVYSVEDFIKWVTQSDPERAAAYYLARIDYWHELPPDHPKRYVTIPHLSDDKTSEVEGETIDQDARARALRTVRDRTIKAVDANDMRWLTEVFARLSQHYAAPALDILREWIDSGEPQKVINAARLLKHAGPNFIFAQETYVVSLLEVAHELDAETFQQVQDSLIASSRPTVSGGWGGTPDPSDEALRDRSAEVSQRYTQDSVAYNFYQVLYGIAIESIEHTRKLIDWPEDEN